MEERKADTSVPIHDLLQKRWSPRAFDASRRSRASSSRRCWKRRAGRLPATVTSRWRYLVWDRERDAEGWQKAFECLSENNRKWVKNVPVLCSRAPAASSGTAASRTATAQHDTGAASTCLALQGAALGLAVHQMGGYDAAKARAAFGIPEEYTPMAMIAVGYQASPDVLDDETKQKELKPRSRKPIADALLRRRLGQGRRALGRMGPNRLITVGYAAASACRYASRRSADRARPSAGDGPTRCARAASRVLACSRSSAARLHPHAVEREDRDSATGSRRRRRLLEMLVHPAQRPSPQEPLVDVAHEHRRQRPVAFEHAQEPLDLIAPLGGLAVRGGSRARASACRRSRARRRSRRAARSGRRRDRCASPTAL